MKKKGLDFRKYITMIIKRNGKNEDSIKIKSIAPLLLGETSYK